MPLKKIVFKPGVNRENTRYTNEMGWYECDKIRFRQGTPEVIGGWRRLSTATYQGVCRALFDWITLGGSKLIAVGTNLKYYVEKGGGYYDITPLADTTTGDATFAATTGSSVLTVTDPGYTIHLVGDFVTFSDAVSLGGDITADVLNQEYQITSVISATEYTIDVGVAATVLDVGDGGSATVAEYQINVGPEIQVPRTGWGASTWSSGTWGVGIASDFELRIWSQSNYGEDLIFAPRYGGIYYWTSSGGISNNRAVDLATMPGASNVPTIQHWVLVSDVSRFVFAFGCNKIGSSIADPMLIRWSDQEDAWNWTPASTNQAGEIRLSHGSEISSALQTRQEIIVWTDSAMYTLQYVGAPVVWQTQLMSDNISMAGPNCAATSAGVVYWMGIDKFYMYDGTVQTLSCDLRHHVYGDINLAQKYQFCSGTNEGFNEIWWFYCSADSNVVDRYVVYNYLEKVWYYGSMGRTAWLDSGTRNSPLAATYYNNIVAHEQGVDDAAGPTSQPIHAFISSSEWDADDGHNFSFMYRMLPDVTFRGSTATNPMATMTVIPLKNSGSGYTDPQSVGGSSSASVVRTAVVPIEEFTGQVFIRVRGRQFVFKVESNQLGTAWQLGSPRVDIRNDGRR